jgi:hypothetical protein
MFAASGRALATRCALTPTLSRGERGKSGVAADFVGAVGLFE